MPSILTEQKVITVTNSDNEINSQIATQAVENWQVSSLTISGTGIIILFTRTTVAA